MQAHQKALRAAVPSGRAMGTTTRTGDPLRPEDDSILDPDVCYRALRSRDARFDGKFFTAVRTTGIYCRPVCPAPAPRQENVVFVACAAAAEAAGFRPCRRCRPETSPGTPAWIGTSSTVSRALRLIGEGYLDDHSVTDLADRVGVGPRHLRRLFLAHLGATPKAVATTRRVHFARHLIDQSELPITQVAFAAGFGSVRQFNAAIRETFGGSPTDIRRRASRSPRADRSPHVPGDLVMRLAYRPPYDWDHVMGYLTDRAIPGVETVGGDVYRRAVAIGEAAGIVSVRPDPDRHAVEVRLPGTLSAHALAVAGRVRRLLDLDADPVAMADHLGGDPDLAAAVRARPGIRVPGAWDPFELAVRAVLGQQVSVRGATTLAGRVAARAGRALTGEELGETVEDGAEGPTHLFPGAAHLTNTDLSGLGITGARIRTLHALSASVLDGEPILDGSCGLDDAVARLTDLPGIGDWTAQYIAMRALREPDAFPAGDLGLRKALARGDARPSTTEVRRRAEAWRPWRAYATVWLWSTLS